MRGDESSLEEDLNKFRKVKHLRTSQVKFLRQGFGLTYVLTLKAFMNTAIQKTVLSKLMGSQLEHFALFEKYLQFEIQSLTQVSLTFIRLKFQMSKIIKGKIFPSISNSSLV